MGIFGGGNPLAPFKKLRVPKEEELFIFLQNAVQQGILTPDEARTFSQDPSQLLDIIEDPSLRSTQLDVIGSLQETIDAGGLDARAKASIEQAQTRADVDSRGQQQAIIADAARRGVAGSGLELASRLSARQNQAQLGSIQGFNAAALGEQRRLDSLRQLGDLSGGVRAQDFGQESAKAQAQDVINAFNTRNRQGVESFNVANVADVQRRNLGEKQRVSDVNTSIANQQETFNKQVPLTVFDAALAKAGGQSRAIVAANAQSSADLGQLFQAGGTFIGGAAAVSDMSAKENVEVFSPAEFLDELIPLQYDYKDQKHGEGRQTGISAQQLEGIAPQAVSLNEQGIKQVETDKLVLPILAALADTSRRVTELEGGA